MTLALQNRLKPNQQADAQQLAESILRRQAVATQVIANILLGAVKVFDAQQKVEATT